MKQAAHLLDLLQQRFDKNSLRHPDIKWSEVQARLTAAPADKLNSLWQMEESGGEPALVWQNDKTGAYAFVDCAAESPKDRRSLCYDQEALEARKAHKPDGSAWASASEMGIRLLNEEEYLKLQELGKYDLKTSSWLDTPATVRSLGGAIFGDRRFDRVFIYHNGAESYYGSRGWRGILEI